MDCTSKLCCIGKVWRMQKAKNMEKNKEAGNNCSQEQGITEGQQTCVDIFIYIHAESNRGVLREFSMSIL